MKRTLAGILAAISLVLCLVFPVLMFQGRIAEDASRFGFFAASVAWFIFASVRVSLGRNAGSR
jgi:hypothetical protein